MRKLSLTLLLVLAPLMAASLALGAYLNYASVRNTYVTMVGDRMEVVARRIASDAQVALSFGLPLAGQDALARTLTRETEADPLLLSVDVVSSAGTVLFSSDAARVDLADPGAADAEAERRTATILSPFETTEGIVVVRGSRAIIAAALGELAGSIRTVAIAAFAVGLALIALIVGINMRSLVGRLTERGSTALGREVPREVMPVFERIDAEHRAIASRVEHGAFARAEHRGFAGRIGG